MFIYFEQFFFLIITGHDFYGKIVVLFLGFFIC